jgi:hypothetical protein
MRPDPSRLMLILVLFCVAAGTAQEKTIGRLSGRVIDDSTKAPVVNANVFIANSMIGTSSDTSGHFEIKNLPAGFYELVSSCVGYGMSAMKIQVIAGADQVVELRLQPRELRMGTVEVTAPQPEAWKENLRVFTKLFLGSTPEVAQCRILNPEVLDFISDPSGNFRARADQEVAIENSALGFRLNVSLGAFSFDGRWISSQFKVRYEEIQPLDPDVRVKWQKSRDEVYAGSLHHFFVALVNGDLGRDGFAMYNPEKLYQLGGNAPLAELKRPDILKPSAPNEWTIRFRNFLVVVYDRREFEIDPGQSFAREFGRFSGNPRLGRSRPQVGILSLTKESLLVDQRGQILDQLALKVSGDWGREGLARQLPLEFQPGSKK